MVLTLRCVQSGSLSSGFIMVEYFCLRGFSGVFWQRSFDGSILSRSVLAVAFLRGGGLERAFYSFFFVWGVLSRGVLTGGGLSWGSLSEWVCLGGRGLTGEFLAWGFWKESFGMVVLSGGGCMGGGGLLTTILRFTQFSDYRFCTFMVNIHQTINI